MKLIYEPKVYLVGSQEVNDSGLNDFLKNNGVEHWTTDGDEAEALVEVAGRVCYMSFSKPRPGGNRAYMDNILQSDHGSVTEHAYWNFIFEGISRTCSHELVRHRAGWAYSQLSQRYVDESVAEYVVPLALQHTVKEACSRNGMVEDGQDITLERVQELQSKEDAQFTIPEAIGLRWLQSVLRDSETYKMLTTYLNNNVRRTVYSEYRKGRVDDMLLSFEDWDTNLITQEQKTGFRKEARQAARSVLPNATETKVFVSANARALRHFIELRCNRHAEPEIRMLAGEVLYIMQTESPNLFGDYELTVLRDGTAEATTKYRKV